jgi:hypothetical protein
MTGKEIVKTALQLIGAVAEGEDPAVEAANEAFSMLQSMLGWWRNDSLIVPSTPELEIDSMTEEVSFPSGYTMAMQYGLAVLLSPKYGRPLRSDIAAIAAQSYDSLVHFNATQRTIPEMTFDPILTRTSGWYDISTGESV